MIPAGISWFGSSSAIWSKRSEVGSADWPAWASSVVATRDSVAFSCSSVSTELISWDPSESSFTAAKTGAFSVPWLSTWATGTTGVLSSANTTPVGKKTLASNTADASTASLFLIVLSILDISCKK